jgi:hypothetical protein
MSRLVELRMHYWYIGFPLLLYFGQWHGLPKKSISGQLSSRKAIGGSVSALSTTLPPKPRHLKISPTKFSDLSWAMSASKRVSHHSKNFRKHRISIGSYLLTAFTYLQRILTSSPQDSRLQHRNFTSSPNLHSACPR